MRKFHVSYVTPDNCFGSAEMVIGGDDLRVTGKTVATWRNLIVELLERDFDTVVAAESLVIIAYSELEGQ